MTEWISVKDRLPQHLQDVLVFDGKVVSFTWFEQIKDRHSRNRKGQFMDLNGDLDAITHWFPIELPPLPKGE